MHVFCMLSVFMSLTSYDISMLIYIHEFTYYELLEIEKVDWQLPWHCDSQEASARTWHQKQKFWRMCSRRTLTASQLGRLWKRLAVIPNWGFSFMLTSCFVFIHILHHNFNMIETNRSLFDCMTPYHLSGIYLITLKTSQDKTLLILTST